jgi:hypothetical protein
MGDSQASESGVGLTNCHRNDIIMLRIKHNITVGTHNCHAVKRGLSSLPLSKNTPKNYFTYG